MSTKVLTFDRGAYEVDGEFGYGTRSEDDIRESGVNIDHNWGFPIPNLPFHPTSQDIAHVRSLLPLPPELVTQILDLAEYWAYFQRKRSDAGQFRNANERYIQSVPILGGDFVRPLRRLVVTTDSRDQGWSSYPEDHGTRQNSWTWFELTLDDGETNREIMRVEVVRNIHAKPVFERKETVIEDEKLLSLAKMGDRLSVWARAMYPGWCNNVRSVEIEAWVAY